MVPEPEVQAAPDALLESPGSHLAALQIDDVADDSVSDGVDNGMDDASEDALDQAFADPLAEPSAMHADESAADDSSDGAMEGALDDDRPTWLGMAAEPRFAEAFDYIRDGKYREALTVYRVALRRDPGDRAARVGIELTEGLKALEERDRMEAAQRFELVLELDPGNQRAAEAIAEMRQQAAAERKEHLAKLRNQQD